MHELIDKKHTEAKVFLLARLFIDRPDREVELVKAVIRRCCEEIDKQPTIESEPLRHGRWIDTPLPNSRVAKCSLCGFWQRTNGDDKTGKHLIHNAVYRYCAGCGARMDLRTPTEVQLDEADSVMMGGADNG